ncbi:Fc.00g075300.m01.CDS01 [Cosmosporella sp. VM-42]
MPSLTTILLATLLTLSPLASARPKRCHGKSSSGGKALYFLTNEDANSVVAVPIAADGSLSGGVLTKTGGKGSTAVDATGKAAIPDGLVSQSSLTVAGNHVFAVNAGSNTLSMFSISKSDPTALTLIGDPVSIPGEFPNTVAASVKNGLVCVGTTGAKAGVSCASFGRKGVQAMDTLREFKLGQTTPPVGPTNTVSQVFFSEDEGMLFSTVKGDPTKNNTGFMAAFSVASACEQNGMVASLAEKEVRSSPNGTAVLFGTLPIPGTSNVFATDASFGGAILAVDEKGQSSLVASQPLDGQKATCWVTISKRTKTAFVTDVAVPRLVEMSLDDASVVNELDLTETGAGGLIDLREGGGFVYALAPGNGTSQAQILVVDVTGGKGKAKLSQRFGLGDTGAGARSQGMAVLA